MSINFTAKHAKVNIKQYDLWPTQDGSVQAQRRPWLTKYSNYLMLPFGIMLMIIVWQMIALWGQYPTFILPTPYVVATKFVSTLNDGTLIRHIGTTVSELMLGLMVGLSSAFLLGYLLGKNPKIERALAPFLVASQSVPIVAIAPLLIIWFGSGLASKVLVCALITFFPTLINTIVGIRNVDSDLRDLMLSLRAQRWQMFYLLELPAAAPYIFGGLKLSVILSVVGAVVGEFVGADSGLGFLINLARGLLDTPLMFVAIISLVILAQMLYLFVSMLEARFLRWQNG